jgi:purine nucleosidase
VDRRKLIIDSDGGVDDAAALWFAAESDYADLVAVTAVWGNVDRGQAARNLGAVLDVAGRSDVPIAIGAGSPHGPAPELAPATFVHGEHGLGPMHVTNPPATLVEESAVELLARSCADHPGEISVVTLGPLSTIAAVIETYPSFALDVGRLVVMGGSLRAGGNALPISEANVAHDPAAAQIVLTAPWRTPPLLVPLDVTYQATLDETHFEALRQHRSAAARFLDEPLHFYRTAGSRLVPGHQCPCHDLLATMAALIPGLVTGPIVEVAVDTGQGPAWGCIVADLRSLAAGEGAAEIPFRRVGRSGLAEVGTHVDVAQFRSHAASLLVGAPRRQSSRANPKDER